MMLCSLEDVKTLLGISGTEQDTKLNLLIKNVSAKITNYLGFSLARSTYTEELHSVNNNQLLKLSHFPIKSVSAVTINDDEIDDYLINEYAPIGFLYRAIGWCGNYYTRGMTHDIVSGEYSIKVTYIAGYYLPGDENYVEGSPDSLPYDIVTACMNGVVEVYNRQGMQGIKAHSEGGISDTFADTEESGLSKSVTSLLVNFKELGVA